MSHDFANLLTSIRGYIDLALAESDRVQRFQYMQKAVRELERGIKLHDKMRNWIESKARLYEE